MDYTLSTKISPAATGRRQQPPPIQRIRIVIDDIILDGFGEEIDKESLGLYIVEYLLLHLKSNNSPILSGKLDSFGIGIDVERTKTVSNYDSSSRLEYLLGTDAGGHPESRYVSSVNAGSFRLDENNNYVHHSVEHIAMEIGTSILRGVNSLFGSEKL